MKWKFILFLLLSSTQKRDSSIKMLACKYQGFKSREKGIATLRIYKYWIKWLKWDAKTLRARETTYDAI